MAIRMIRKENDEILRKTSKHVKEINANVLLLLDDMAETLKKAQGIGLAAPQVGALKRIFIIDAGEGVVEFINPEIISTEGEKIEYEGCLSIPGKVGKVKRYEKVTVKATDRKGNEFITEGIDLMSKALQHEYDHLEGFLYTDKAINVIDEDDMEDEE